MVVNSHRSVCVKNSGTCGTLYKSLQMPSKEGTLLDKYLSTQASNLVISQEPKDSPYRLNQSSSITTNEFLPYTIEDWSVIRHGEP